MSLTIVTHENEEKLERTAARAIQASRDEGGNRVVLRCHAGLLIALAAEFVRAGGGLSVVFGIYTASRSETDERAGWCVEIDPSMPILGSLE